VICRSDNTLGGKLHGFEFGFHAKFDLSFSFYSYPEFPDN
jgi:hypothetical protein